MDTAMAVVIKMSEAINGFGRTNNTGSISRAKSGDTSKTGVDNPAPLQAKGGDEVVFSERVTAAMNRADFDQEKVDRIKKAIEEGNYPVNTRRIAENFAALERMIGG